MKKLILSAVIILGSLSIHAKNSVEKNLIPLVVIQDEYKEIDAVPAAIKSALDDAYPGVKLEKAYINQKKEYKIEIIVREVKSTVYTDALGIIIKK